MSIAEQNVALAYWLAHHRALPTEDRDDVVSDALFGLVRAEAEWDGERPFGPFAAAWIIGQIHRGRRARTGMRADFTPKTPRPVVVSLDRQPGPNAEPPVAALPDESPEPAEAIEARDLWASVDQLPDVRQRKIVRLYFQFGYSQHEIARILGVSQMHVSRLLRAALASLACTLGPTHALAA